jgi:hypothetical protein
MTTIRQIVIDAMRDGGLIEVGTTPEAEEFTEAFNRLQVIVKSLFSNELSGGLVDVNYGTYSLANASAIAKDYSSLIQSAYVPKNIRLVVNNNTATTLYLDPIPQDGSRVGIIDNVGNFATAAITLNGNGRKVENTASVVLNTNSLVREWFYRADLGSWTRITDLTADSDSPLPTEFDDLLVTLLAMRINHRYGEQTSQETSAILTRIRNLFKSRYRQTQEIGVEEALQRLSSHPRWADLSNSSTRFNSGII